MLPGEVEPRPWSSDPNMPVLIKICGLSSPDTLDVALPLRALFENPTLHALSERILTALGHT